MKVHNRFCIALVAGEHLIAGTDAVIRWESIGVEGVRIEFSPNGGGVWYPLVGARCNVPLPTWHTMG